MPSSRALLHAFLAVLQLLLVSYPLRAAAPREGSLPDIEARAERDPARFEAGQTRILARENETRLAGFGEDLRIKLIETEGAELSMRLTPLDRDGTDLGVGRVILIAPSERRDVSLRKTFAESQLEGVQLRVEALRGKGRVNVIASTSDGGELRFAPEAEHVRRRPVQLKSTDTLIDDAEASGAINHETAVLYRVYALFSDTRLPGQYRGVDREITDSLYLESVRGELDSFSDATQELLLPFLTPPAYPGSWGDPATRAKGAQATPPQCQFFSGDWAFVESPRGLVRVWYRKDLPDALRASSVGTAVDTKIWDEFKTLLGRTPVTDQAVSCNGGSPNLDIYLTELADVLGLAVPYQGCSGNAPPYFLLIKRTENDSVVAHEVFHAFTAAFPLRACQGHSDYKWWTEGSATWAMHRIYPDAQFEHRYAPHFLSIPERPLDIVDPKLHMYGSYLLPFYESEAGLDDSFIRATWAGCAGKPALEAFDGAVSDGFKELWPDFTRNNWNAEPVRDYFSWDKVPLGVKDFTPPLEVRLGGAPDGNELITVDLPRLSAKYTYYKFTDDNVRTVAFWNGVTKQLSQPDEFEVDEASDAQKKGGRIQALVKIRGQDWTEEDWTEEAMVSFCRDRRAERIDELVVIVSNSEFADRGRKLRPANIQPLLWASNMGCWKWKGRANGKVGYQGREDTLIEIDSPDVTFTSFGSGAPGGGGAPFFFYSAAGKENWKVTGHCRGSGTLDINPGTGFLMTYNFTPPGGKKHRGYAVAGIDSRQVDIECKNGAGGYDPAKMLLPPWIFSEAIEPPLPNVKSDGIIDGRRDPEPDSTGTYTWHFEAQREPGP